MKTVFGFALKTRIRFGIGVRHDAYPIIAKEGWKRVGIVVDHNLLKLTIVEDFIGELRNCTERLTLGKCSFSEPTYDSLEEMRDEFCDPCLQAVIGIGGGSALDMAKAMAVLVNNKRPSIEYRGFDKMTEPVLPIIAVPSTAGTGSEVTPNASFIDSYAKKKLGINGEAVRPMFAFLDPELTASCPREPTISAGVDSMVHAVEAFAAKKSNPLARFFATEGFRMVFVALPQVIDDLGNMELRQDVMYGAFLSGVALMHSGTGPAAALSYPLSVHFNVPHGLGGGVFLPVVIEHNVRYGFTEYGELLDLRVADSTEASERFLREIEATWKHLGIPRDLDRLGINTSDLDLIVRETMELKGALDQNPVPFYEEEIRSTLNSLIKGSEK